MYFVNKNDVSDKIGLRRLQLAYPNTSFPESPTDEDLVGTGYITLDERSGMDDIVLQPWQTVLAEDVIQDGKAFTVYTVIDDGITSLKAAKKSEVNGWRTVELSNGFEYGGHKWDCDMVSAFNIATCFSSGKPPECGYWTSYENVDVPADFAFIEGLHSAMIAKGNYIHDTQRDMKKAIDALQTVQEVMEFDVNGYSNQTA